MGQYVMLFSSLPIGANMSDMSVLERCAYYNDVPIRKVSAYEKYSIHKWQ